MKEINVYSEEYMNYAKCLSYLASGYVPSIRKKFAAKAQEMYNNETVRKLVLAYGAEYEKKQADFEKEFLWAAQDEPEHTANYSEIQFETSCLNKATSYGEALKFFFEI